MCSYTGKQKLPSAAKLWCNCSYCSILTQQKCLMNGWKLFVSLLSLFTNLFDQIKTQYQAHISHVCMSNGSPLSLVAAGAPSCWCETPALQQWQPQVRVPVLEWITSDLFRFCWESFAGSSCHKQDLSEERIPICVWCSVKVPILGCILRSRALCVSLMQIIFPLLKITR